MNVLPSLCGQLEHLDTAGLLLSHCHNVCQLFSGQEVVYCGTVSYIFPLRSILAASHGWFMFSVRLHVQTCRWQMVSGDIRGESSPLAELTLKVSGRLGSRSEPTLPCRESEGWTSSPHGLRKFNYRLMKSELTSPHHRHSTSPPPSLLSCSWSSSWTVAGQGSR